MFASQSVLATIVAAVSQSKLRPTIIIIADDDGPSTGALTQQYLTFQAFVGNSNVHTNVSSFATNAQNQREKVALLLSSSGTTGLPKAVQLTEQNLLLAIAHAE